ncbi:putative succinate-semialdehyde dehydrogenase, partial [Emericellopsis atlantica]
LEPATTKLIGRCPEFSKVETNEAIQSAHDAFQLYQTTSARQRSRLLRKWYELVIHHQEDLSVLITMENGKPLSNARDEVAYAASFLEWFSEEAPRTYGDVIPASNHGSQVLTLKEPLGVCALITPWNFPAAMITRKAGAALAAGCTVVIKSPAETPFTVNALVELAYRAGFPRGIINVVTALSNTVEVVHTLTSSPLVHKVSFTGSTNVGKILMRQCAETTVKKISLELGGNAPFIVFEDADLDAAVDGVIICKFRSSGQTCVSANRIYVHDSVYAEFASKLAARVQRDFVVGNGLTTPGVTHGPLIHEKALEKTLAHIRDAVTRGATIASGGSAMPQLGPHFLEPTIVTDMTHDMQVACDETFGPVAGLFRFTTEKEVIALANSTDMGLAGYFYSRNIQRLWRVARALQVGMVGVNTGLISDPASPFGGVKSSGFGREGGRYGIEEYMTTKTITLGGLEPLAQSRL